LYARGEQSFVRALGFCFFAQRNNRSQVKKEAVPGSQDAIGVGVVTDSWSMADISPTFCFVQSGLNFSFSQQ
jgi:hypothetical protein